MQYASAPYVITEEEDSKDKKVGKAKNFITLFNGKMQNMGVRKVFYPLF